MFHLYIGGRFIKSYDSHKAAQCAIAKMRHKVDITGWKIIEVK